MATNASFEPVNGTLSVFKRVDKVVTNIGRGFYWIAGAGLILMLVLVIADIVGIKALANPVPGGIEIVAFLGVVVNGFAIAFVEYLHGHIQVDVVIMKIPPRPKAIIEAVMVFLSLLFFAVLAWRTWDYAATIQAANQVSMTQRIPIHPFIYALSACYLVSFFILVMELVKAILKAVNRWTP